jgi:TM2 domain-containing membrane protein YozV
METEWYLVREHGGEQYGPFRTSELQGLVDDGRLTPTDRMWSEGMSEWEPASSLANLGVAWPQMRKIPPPVNPYEPTVPPGDGPRYDESDRFIAAALAFLLGGLGVHKIFYGATSAGITMLLISILPICMGFAITVPISIIEGVIFLTKSPEEFHRIYRVEKKGWF